MRGFPAVLLLPCALCAQPFAFGVKAGVPLTVYFETGQTGGLHGGAEYSAATRRYTLGPSIEYRFGGHLGLELDALFKRMGYVGIIDQFSQSGVLTHIAMDSKGDSWDIPLLLKYRFAGKVRPFVAAGGVMRYVGPVRARGEITVRNLVTGTTAIQPIDTTSPSDLNKRFYPGVTAGIGVEFGLWRMRVVPEFRYVRWTANIAGEGGLVRFAPNQAEVLVGFVF